jgi:L-ascorbate metabolism protein UlaG (beta-lactamase superfamily)
MILFLVIIGILIAIVSLYTRQPKFGRKPRGKRLQTIRKSPHYKKGKFQNLRHTPSLTEGHSYAGVTYDFFFKRNPRRAPSAPIPSVKTNLHQLDIHKDIYVWFGHSSYFLQLNGKRMLVDPVFSGNASPISGSNKAFSGADIYTTEDIPEIDYLFITHDHYDHLDHDTIVKLKNKIKKTICGLGVAEHLERWGYEEKDILEKDWNETIPLDKGFIVHTTTARHFSGRGFVRNNTLWMSYVLQTPDWKIFIGGDSGYDVHFNQIGQQHGPFDFAILENGQYDAAWKYIHALPDEVLTAAQELKAKKLIPVHSGKFAMANHAWDDPLTKLTLLNQQLNVPILTPLIGEAVDLKKEEQEFKPWWKELS